MEILRKYWWDREQIHDLNLTLHKIFEVPMIRYPMFGVCIDCIPKNEPLITKFCYFIERNIWN